MGGLSFPETNAAVLRKVYPGLLEELLRHPAGADGVAAETAASGAPTLAVNGLYVHSPRDPAREGQRLAQALLAGAGDDDGPVLVTGFGLGYAAEAVAALAPRRPIVVVEKNPGLLRLAFELRDFSAFLSRPGIAFVPGGDGDGAVKVLAFFEKSAAEKKAGERPTDKKRVPLVLRNRTLAAVDEAWYAAVENRVRAWATQGDVNRATLKKFGKRWIRNLTRNMTAIRDMPGVSLLAGIAARDRPVPVFLAAAGPSLDGMGSLLPEIRKRCIVVAVDTSLRFFCRNNVEPDFVLVVDPQFWNSQHLNRCAGGRGTRLVAESAVYPPVLRLPFAGKFLCGSLFPLGTFIEKRVDPKGLLGAGGSVATSAWDFCRVLGAAQIWVAGLDLAFPGGKTHFRGALFEEKALSKSGRLKPAETFLHAALRDGVPFPAASVSGGKVLTDRRLSLYASWFENNLRNSPGIRNHRLWRDGGDTDGLAISGFEKTEAEKLLELPDRRAEIDDALACAFSRVESDFLDGEQTRQRHRRYDEALALLQSGLEKTAAACRAGESLAALALQTGAGPAEREKTAAALGEINRAITESAVREIAGFLLPEETLREMDAPGFAAGFPAGNENAFRERLEFLLGLYRALLESSAAITFAAEDSAARAG